MSDVFIPRINEMLTPTVLALHKLGGSGTNREIHDEVVAILSLSDEQIQSPHKPGSSQTAINYRLGWVRNRLKHYGLLENTGSGVWALTKQSLVTSAVDEHDLQKAVRAQIAAGKSQHRENSNRVADDAILTGEESETFDELVEWRDELHELLLQMDPSAFERLCQRLLRESGFTQVEVTGRSGDGGIDGIGVLRLGGFLSIRVLFQCKRYKGSIGAGIVRDFRGAMVGRTDKGLIVTTGNFTPAAQREATRDGAPEIDLVDGEQLIDKLKELSLGVETEEVIVERVTVDPDFFNNI